MKKLFQGAVVGAAMLGLMGSASAANLTLNLYGASAQHTFWNAAVPVYLSTYLGCDSVNTDNTNSKHGISVGSLCDLTATDADTITIRYSSNNSSFGIGATCGMQKYSDNDPTVDLTANPPRPPCPAGQIYMCAAPGSCGTTARTCQEVHVGASDVELTSFTQTVDQPNTWTYTYSVQCPDAGNQSAEFLAAGCPGIFQLPNGTAKSVVVPFGFFASNDVTKWRCTAPAPTGPAGEHYAYPHWGWQCLETDENGNLSPGSGKSTDCIGYFKCVGGVCSGGARVGQPCTSGLEKGPLGCPDSYADTACKQMPIDNLSRLMVLQIFSKDNEDWLDRWNQFGPWYPDAGIVRCMRCAGSGTHATLDMQVFRGDALIMDASLHGRFYHHESSSDLTKCVDENGWPASWGTPSWATDQDYGPVRYAVGYADVDKIINSTSYPNTHIVKYQGVEPARAKIENNEYNFWAAQTLYWNPTEITNLGLDALLNDPVKGLIAAAQNQGFLNGIFPQNMFWTTNGAMACQKTPFEPAYPTVVSTTSPYYPNAYDAAP